MAILCCNAYNFLQSLHFNAKDIFSQLEKTKSFEDTAKKFRILFRAFFEYFQKTYFAIKVYLQHNSIAFLLNFTQFLDEKHLI